MVAETCPIRIINGRDKFENQINPKLISVSTRGCALAPQSTAAGGALPIDSLPADSESRASRRQLTSEHARANKGRSIKVERVLDEAVLDPVGWPREH